MVMWDGTMIPMHDIEALQDLKKALSIYQDSLEPSSTNEDTKQNVCILYTNYQKSNLKKVIEKNCAQLEVDKQIALLEVLLCYKVLFDRSLGDWDITPLSFELKKGAKPYHIKAFPVPYIHKEAIQKEVIQICHWEY